MPQRSARIQYLLLAVVAALALLHTYGGTRMNFNLLAHGEAIARPPFESGLRLATTTNLQQEALAAGLRPFDTILTINGQPYSSRSVLLAQTRSSAPGDPMTVTYRRGADGPIQSATIHLAPSLPQKLSPLGIAARLTFAVLPFFCLLIGLWVVFARPRNPNAWLILGILGYVEALFINPMQTVGSFIL